jgi:regulatory protein
MKITAINPQARDANRVSVLVDGVFSFSLDIAQVVDCGLKTGQEIDAEKLAFYKNESNFGKLYNRALEYCLLRPRSRKEVADYLFKKTRPSRDRKGELKAGFSLELTDRVLERLVTKRYIDDLKFATFWVENRLTKKGVSRRRLTSELSKKGVRSDIIQDVLAGSDRNDLSELTKIIEKKARRYDDEQKLMAYLARQGFGYEDIKQAIASRDAED